MQRTLIAGVKGRAAEAVLEPGGGVMLRLPLPLEECSNTVQAGWGWLEKPQTALHQQQP